MRGSTFWEKEMKAQVIEKNRMKELVVISWKDIEQIREAQEDYDGLLNE